MHHQRFPLGGVGGAVALPDGEGDIMRIIAESLTEKAFAPYGNLLAASAEFGRAVFDEGRRSSRAPAWPSLSVSPLRPLPRLLPEARMMVRPGSACQFCPPLYAVRTSA